VPELDHPFPRGSRAWHTAISILGAVVVLLAGCSGHAATKSAAGAIGAAGAHSAAPTAPAASSTTAPVAAGSGAAAKAPAPVVANPCALVTKPEAQAIIGKPIADPQLAAQGPTCIYKTPDSTTFITLAMQARDFSQIKPRIENLTPVTVRNHEAYCGTYGTSTLYVVLKPNSFLAVTGPCPTATRFATIALPRIG
jgi:hypothetical protein